jgi:hypothetical protein
MGKKIRYGDDAFISQNVLYFFAVLAIVTVLWAGHVGFGTSYTDADPVVMESINVVVRQEGFTNILGSTNEDHSVIIIFNEPGTYKLTYPGNELPRILSLTEPGRSIMYEKYVPGVASSNTFELTITNMGTGITETAILDWEN